MTNNFSMTGKEVRINGQSVITNWRTSKIADPSNLQQKIMEKNTAKQEVLDQKKFVPKSNNSI